MLGRKCRPIRVAKPEHLDKDRNTRLFQHTAPERGYHLVRGHRELDKLIISA
jgi:hypothetical protein